MSIVSLDQCVNGRDNYWKFEELSKALIKDHNGEYKWLYMEWADIAGDIKRNASYRGIHELVGNQSINEIVDVVVSKMYSGSREADLNKVSYRYLMQAAKTKAIEDWVECQRSLDNISDMLTQMFKSK